MRRGRSKYNAVRTEVNGIMFDSKKEAARYWDLFLMEKAHKISDLKLQPAFKFPCGFTYKADFRYFEDGKDVVEDVKGFQTRIFKMKLKMLKVHFPEVELKIT